MWELDFSVPGEIYGPISSLKFSPNGNNLAAGYASGKLVVYDLEKKDVVGSINAHTKGINQVKWSQDGEIIITCSDDGRLNAFRSSDLEQISECVGHHSYITCCDISVYKDRIASGSFDESVRIWETSSGKCTRMISAHSDPVSSVVFSSDGNFVISSSWDGFCRFFETYSGVCVYAINLAGVPITHMEISPNDAYLLCSLQKSQIKLMSIKDSKLKKIYSGHLNRNYALFAGFIYRETPNGIKVEVYSGSENLAAIGWNLEGDPIWKIDYDGCPSVAVDVHPAGLLLATAGAPEGTNVKVWRRNADNDPLPLDLPEIEPEVPEEVRSEDALSMSTDDLAEINEIKSQNEQTSTIEPNVPESAHDVQVPEQSLPNSINQNSEQQTQQNTAAQVEDQTKAEGVEKRVDPTQMSIQSMLI